MRPKFVPYGAAYSVAWHCTDAACECGGVMLVRSARHMAAVRKPQKALFDVLCTRRRGTMCEIARFSYIVPQGCGCLISSMFQEWLVSAVFQTGVLPRCGLKAFVSVVVAHCCGTTARKTLNRRIVPQMACCTRGRARRKGCASRAWGVLCVERYAVRMAESSEAVARHDETVRDGVVRFRRKHDITGATVHYVTCTT